MKLVRAISILLALSNVALFAQQSGEHEVLVEFYVVSLPSTEMNIILRDTEAYIPMRKTFDYLGIWGDFRPADMQLSGFFKNPDTSYSVNFREGTASIRGRKFSVSASDYIYQADTLYLRTGFLNELFNLDFKYSSRRVRVELKRSRGLPAVTAIARHRRYAMLARRQVGLPSPDYFLGHEPYVLGAGRFDWSASTTLTPSRYLGTRFNTGLGLQILSGDFTATDNGFVDHGRNENTFRGQYRLPFLDNMTIQQIIAGDFVSNGIQARFVRGGELTNRPLAQRFSYTREVFHGQFEPNIDVDVTGVSFLPQYQQTNDLGIYQFDVPVIYGQGLVEINAYDPWGRVQTLRYRMNVSRDLVPPGELEYSIAGGKTRPPVEMWTSTNYLKWGVSSDFTVGMKLEYFDLDNVHQKFFPSLTATSRLGNSLILSGSVAPQALSTAGLSWLFLTGADLEVLATQYADNAFFNPAGIRNDINATLLLPLATGRVPFGIGSSFEQTAYDALISTNFQLSLNATFGIFSPRLSALYAWRQPTGGTATPTQRLYDAAFTLYLPARVIFQPELTYDQINNNVNSVLATVSKSVGPDFRMIATYGRFPQVNSYSIGLSLTYYLPFMRAQGGATSVNGHSVQYNTAQAGSVGFDTRNGNLFFQNVPTFVGLSGLVVHPFYDANNNGVDDPGEEVIDKAHIYYTNVTRNTPPVNVALNTLTLSRLPSYENFDVYLDPQSLDNPVWVPRYASFRILSEPNYIREISIPVVTGGTARGTVYIIQDNVKKPAEEIKLTITGLSDGGTEKKRFTKTLSTFSTGEFEFSPLPPGKYRIELDLTQLRTLGYTASPSTRDIELMPKAEGDIVSGIDFTLVPQR